MMIHLRIKVISASQNEKYLVSVGPTVTTNISHKQASEVLIKRLACNKVNL